MLNRPKTMAGLTFLEMLIVMSILIVMTLIAVPTFITFVQERRLTMTAEKLYAAILNARYESIKSNSTVYVTFESGDNWCFGANTGNACTCSTPSSCNLGTIAAEAPQQLTLSTTALSNNSFQFESNRGASTVSNGKATLTIYGQSTSVTVLISRLGNIQLCSSMNGYQVCP